MCRKKCYPSEEVAIQVLWKMVARKIGAGKLPCRAYKCPDGNHWHLTSRSSEATVSKQERIVKTVPVRPKPGPPPINTTTPSGKPLPW